MTYNLFINNCPDQVFENSFRSVYEKTVGELDANGVFFLKREYIEGVNLKTGAFSRILSLVTSEAEKIEKDKSASLYALFLYNAMQERETFKANIKYFKLPEQYPLFAFLCFIPVINSLYDRLTLMGIDSDIISQTVGQFEECTFIYKKRFDRIGLNKRYFDWLQHYVDLEILNINRLRFEIHALSEPICVLRELRTGADTVVMSEGEFRSDGLYSDTPPLTDALFSANMVESDSEYIAYPVSEGGRAQKDAKHFSKEKYVKIIEKGDTVLSVHIPVEGEFTPKTCKESYLRALKVFKRHFSDLNVKGFVCYSWMMSPELRQYMREGSRVLAFASPYMKFPIHTEGEDVLNFVFYLRYKTYEDLPEDTSLQRALKTLYLGGGYLYEYGGIFAADRAEDITV